MKLEKIYKIMVDYCDTYGECWRCPIVYKDGKCPIDEVIKICKEAKENDGNN